MARPAKRDVDAYRGDTHEHVITLVESDEVTPMDMSAYTFAATLRESPDGVEIADFTIDQTDADVGVVIISIAANVMAALTKTAYFYDVQTTLGSVVETRMRGKFTVTKDLTY